jgi:hypothetical protein
MSSAYGCMIALVLASLQQVVMVENRYHTTYFDEQVPLSTWPVIVHAADVRMKRCSLCRISMRGHWCGWTT